MTGHLDELEREAIHLIREICSTNDPSKIVVLYSLGKDSSVLLRLFEKAFYPEKLPISFMHIDTGWKFPEMYQFREKIAKKIKLIVYKNPKNLNPFEHGRYYTDIMKTEALKQALDSYKFRIAFGGARREEEKSRAKERMVSIRDEFHKWNPRNQNPEVCPLYNTLLDEKSSLMIFPLSNWTEIDIWEYIKKENIEVVPIYFSHKRKVISKNGLWISSHDDSGEIRTVRFRTLGCYPLTAATESEGVFTVEDIINDLKKTKYTERITRVIDYDTESSMELKKKEGYF